MCPVRYRRLVKKVSRQIEIINRKGCIRQWFST
jgi:hypothetical protein